MSMFGKPGSGGGGISTAQLDQLVSDPELASAAGVLAAAIAEHRGLTVNTYDLVGQRADIGANNLADFRTRLMEQLGAILNRGNALSLNGIEYRYSMGDDVAAIKAAVVDTPLVYSGKMEWVNRASGLPSAGYTKAGGVGVPENMFNTLRSQPLPYTQGASAMTGNSAAAAAYRAVVGDKVYALQLTSVNFRAYDHGVASWGAPLPNYPVTSNLYPTTFGTVNGKPVATGCQSSSSGVTNSLTTYDAATSAWVPRATQPASRCHQGIADIGSGKCALFGGKTVHDGTAESATNIVNEVTVYSDTANTYTAKAALPVRMNRVRTAVRADGGVFLLPTFTSDGATLVSTGRRVFLWNEATGTVELDAIPAECVATPWLLHARADGCLVFVPYATPSSGSRARLLNPAAAAGSQWSGIDWDYNDQATYNSFPGGCEAKATASGFAITSQAVSSSSSGLFATYVGASFPNWSQTFIQIKN